MSDKLQIIFTYKIGSNEFYGCRNPNAPDMVKHVEHNELVNLLRSTPKNTFNVKLAGDAIIPLDGISIERLNFGEFIIGEDLSVLCADFIDMKHRDAYYEAEEFVTRKDTVRLIGLIYGMRSTGKTVILKQLAGRSDFVSESAYLTLNYDEYSINDVYTWMKNLQRIGIKYFYVDEITWADGFADRAMGFADKFASHSSVRIILSGTDSLAFTFAKQSSLHGRYMQFSTTRMSYPEYRRITNGDILDYLRSGGVFWRNERPNAEELEDYLHSSVVRNFLNSINATNRKVLIGEDIRYLEERELYAICYAICESVALSYVKGHAAYVWDEPMLKIVDSALRRCGVSIPHADKAEIRKYAPIFSSETTKFDASKVDAVIELMLQIGFLWKVDVKTDRGMQTRLVFAQTGVARSFALLAMQTVINSGVLKESETKILDGIEAAAEGSMLELACLITFAKRIEKLTEADIFLSHYRIYTGEHEVDIVVHDRRASTLYLYEVKRSANADAAHARHIADNEFIKFLKMEYGVSTVKRAVLYRGDDTEIPQYGAEIPYYNVGGFLLRVENGDMF